MDTRFAVALISLIPSIAICVYVYLRDKKEREPLWLLALIFGVNAAVAVPVVMLSERLGSVIGRAFAGDVDVAVNGAVTWSSSASKLGHNALVAFVSIALVEEVVRWLAVYFITHKSKHFNCIFDGVVYSVVAAIGAAVARNFYYAFTDSWETFVLRAVESVPWYLFFGIVSGVFYTLWYTRRYADRYENLLVSKKILAKDRLRYPAVSLILSLLIPVLVHGLYSFFMLMRKNSLNRNITTYFYVFAGVMMIVCVIVVWYLSRKDKTTLDAAEDVIEEEHGVDVDNDGLIAGGADDGDGDGGEGENEE